MNKKCEHLIFHKVDKIDCKRYLLIFLFSFERKWKYFNKSKFWIIDIIIYKVLIYLGTFFFLYWGITFFICVFAVSRIFIPSSSQSLESHINGLQNIIIYSLGPPVQNIEHVTGCILFGYFLCVAWSLGFETVMQTYLFIIQNLKVI